MRWSLGHRHIHTHTYPDIYNVINQPGGLWAGLSGTDGVLSNDHQIREDYIHTLVICLRNITHWVPVCVRQKRERETVYVCQYEYVTVSSVWETFVYMHVCVIMEGKQCQATHSEELQAYDPIKAMLTPAMHCNISIMHLPEKDNLIQQD